MHSTMHIGIRAIDKYISACVFFEVRVGIEPTYGSFANCSVTTSPPHRVYFIRFPDYLSKLVEFFHSDQMQNQIEEFYRGELLI